MQEVLASTSEGIAVYELDGRLAWQNPASEKLMRMSLSQTRGKKLFDLFPAGKGGALHLALQRVTAGGGPELLEHFYAPFQAWYVSRVTRVGDRVHVFTREATAEVRRRRHLEVLARVSAIVTDDSVGQREAMSRVAREVSQVLDADCVISALAGAQLRPLGSASKDPQVEAQFARLPERRAEGPLAEALRSHELTLIGAEALAQLPAHLSDPEVKAAFVAYAPVSVLAMPLVTANEVSGVLLAGRRGQAAPLTEEDLALVTELAPQLALYLAHADRRAEALSLRDRLSTLADVLPVLFALVDRDARYQYVNRGYEQLQGRPREQFIGRSLREMATSAEAYAVAEPNIRSALSGTPVRFQSRVRTATLGERDVDVRYVPVRDASNQISGFAVLAVDVTSEVQVRQLEQEQRVAERRGARRLEVLLEAARHLAAANQIDEMARVLVDEALGLFDSKMAAVYVLSADGNELVQLAQRGFSARFEPAMRVTSIDSDGPLAQCLRTGRPVWLESRADFARRFPDLEAFSRLPAELNSMSLGVWPLIVEGRPVGCAAIGYQTELQLKPDDRTFLEVLASHGAEGLRRARLYAELQDASETRQAMIAASPQPIVLTDQRGVIETWNPAAERVFGWSQAEVVGKLAPHAGTRRDEMLQLMSQVAEGKVLKGVVVRRQRKNGDWFDAELFAAPVRSSDGRVRLLAMFVDVAQRQRLERGRKVVADATAALSRSLELEQTLAEVVKLPVAELADWCCIDLVDQGQLRRVAIAREQVGSGMVIARTLAHDPAQGGLSQAIDTTDVVLQRDVDDQMLERLARDAEHLAQLHELKVKSSISMPVKTADRVVGAITMVSSTRNFDETDQLILSELASHVASAIVNARLYTEARQARSLAESASRAKDEFLAMLGHELRNPLAPMRTALELMRLRAPQHSVRERGVIHRQVDHLARLVDDLLDVSRITKGKVELRKERTLVSHVVAKALEQASSLLEEKHHRVSVEVSETLAVNADPTRLAQVVANLLTNAAKYTPPSGHVHVSAQRDGGRAVLSVTDDGVGIAAEVLPHVFESFVQAPQTSARPEGGLGLGLTIVKNLVELHGGTVSARSEGPGHGTTVTVSLPALSGDEVTASRAPDKASAKTQVIRKVLIVDDNEDAAVMLGEVLESGGHQLQIAFDGPSALKLAAERWPEVAVLDIGLPVMDGYELAEKLRALANGRPLRLIALTGYGQASQKQRAFEVGFNAHFAKPVELDALIAQVEAPVDAKK
ncbi:MAG: PAS domain-containing protein [Archangiaceae bacterium]|nr:PAS domain-containing protein [Archangiaceae bacterium]